MPESFGARLRQQREARQIALSSIADETKIKFALLEALERDDVSHWPAGIFRRAYIKAYAHTIGLDPEEMVREFLEAHPEPAEGFAAAAIALAAAEEAVKRNGAPPTRLRNMVDSAIGSLARLRRPAGSDDPGTPGTRLGGQVTQPAAAAEPAAVPIERALDDTPFQDIPAIEPAALAVEPEFVVAVAAASPAIEPEAFQATPAAPEPAPIEAVAAAPPPPPVPVAEEAPRQEVEPRAAGTAPPAAAAEPSGVDVDLEAVAGLCTAFARVVDRVQVQQLMQETAHLLEAVGLVVWIWDETSDELRPTLVHGYSDKVLAQLPPVRRDGDNATAAAFRSAHTVEIPGSSKSCGALVVPLLTPEGCAGVFAIELQQGARHMRSTRAMATILAAVLAPLAVRPRPGGAQTEPPGPAVQAFGAPTRPVRVRR